MIIAFYPLHCLPNLGWMPILFKIIFVGLDGRHAYISKHVILKTNIY